MKLTNIHTKEVIEITEGHNIIPEGVYETDGVLSTSNCVIEGNRIITKVKDAHKR
jgi:hypothetical protein